MQRDFVTRLKSRKFLYSLATTILILINEAIGRPVNEDAYWVIAALVIGWIIGESAIDACAAKANLRD